MLLLKGCCQPSPAHPDARPVLSPAPTEPLPVRMTCAKKAVAGALWLQASWLPLFPLELTTSTSKSTHAAMGLGGQFAQRWEFCLWLDELLDFLILKILSIVMAIQSEEEINLA